MSGRTWKTIDSETAEKIKSHLLENGGTMEEITSVTEVWRIKYSDSTFTYYKSGTLFGTESNAKDPAVLTAWETIGSIAGPSYVSPTRDFLIGLDETGKGELAGHTVLTGVIFPRSLFDRIDLLAGPADTKTYHKFAYWDDIFKKLDGLRSSGFYFIMEKIPPWTVDKYRLNKIMDVTYQRLLSIFFRKAEISRCRIVLDDYGVGPTLQRFLFFLQKQGAEVITSHQSDQTYLEAKAASLVSKRERERLMDSINRKPEFQVDGLTIGSGNAGDKKTLEWLRKWHQTGKAWPWFIKISFRTIAEIEGKSVKIAKLNPPIREDLLSRKFIEEFNKGNLSVQSLSIVCPSCGAFLRSAMFATIGLPGSKLSKLKCSNPECNQFIEDAGTTLRYYCGYVIPDSSVIRRTLISHDLSASRFFENFTVILHPVVRKECDGTAVGKKEFDELRRY